MTPEELRKLLAILPPNEIRSEGGEIQTNVTPRPLAVPPSGVPASSEGFAPNDNSTAVPLGGTRPHIVGDEMSTYEVKPPPPLSGYIPTNYSGQERTDYVQQMGRNRLEIPDSATAQDKYDYAYGKRTDNEGRFIDRDSGKGSAFKNFMKGLGMGFLRGGIGGALAGGIMNTARGNMDEEFAWNTWHRPSLEQGVAMEGYQDDQRRKEIEAARKAVLDAADLRGKNISQANTLSLINERERKASSPDYEKVERNGIMFQRDKNDPEGNWEPVEALGVEKGKQYKQRTIQGEDLWVTDAQYADYLKAEAAEKAKIEGEIRKENRDIRMKQYEFKLKLALEEYNDTVALLKSEQDFKRRAQLQTQAEQAREKLARIRQEANDLE